MDLRLQRFVHGKDSTGGVLTMNGQFFCYTVEDQKQPAGKVMHETRIPEGRYQILLRNEGGMTQRYKEKFLFHEGMLWLQDVPGFEWVYIHIGNTDDDTSGCVLVGRGIRSGKDQESRISESTLAYTELYNLIRLAMDRGEEIWIEVV